MNSIDMKNFGLSSALAAEADLYDDLYVGRVISQSKDLYRVVAASGELTAEISGKFRFGVARSADYPAVGDFVMLDRDTGAQGNAIIHHVLPRKSAFIRKAAGTSNDEQVVATNIDTIFICMALNKDFNLRRLERYLSIAWDSRALPVIVLTKSDLCADIPQKLNEVAAVAIGVEVLVTTSLSEEGYLQVLPYIRATQTVAFIGSSGVGKSSLINCLLGEGKLATREIRDDDKGKHTTTRRELILLADGGMVIDTPGMRELGLESADLGRTFADIEELATQCKFHDCTHISEPGCAVQEAVRQGFLSDDRLAHYRKLEKEAKYEGLNSRQIEGVKLEEMFSGMGGLKNVRDFIKAKNAKKR